MSFVKVSESEYNVLLQLMKERLPKSAMPHNVLQMHESGIIPPSAAKKSIYVFISDGNDLKSVLNSVDLFLIIILDRLETIHKDKAILLSPPERITLEMRSALKDLIEWDIQLFFCAVDTRLSPNIINLAQEAGPQNLDKVRACDFLIVPIEIAKEIRITPPDGVEVSELRTPQDSKYLVDNWQHALPNSDEFIAEEMRVTGSGAVYVDGQIVSCVGLFGMGSINALFTSPEHRGKGYAALTMNKICQLAGSKGLISNVQVEFGNHVSKNLMLRLGFQESHEIQWIWYGSRFRK